MPDQQKPFPPDAPVDNEASGREELPIIGVEATPCFNFAAWQNDVPLLRKLWIDNTRGGILQELRLELESSSSFIREKRWGLQRVDAGAVFFLRDLDLDVDPQFLDGLDEAERTVLTFRLYEREQLLTEIRQDVRVLARDEWGGMGAMSELLAAFVSPNDPALSPLLKSAADVLARHGHSAALDGYQSADPGRAYLLAAALWSAIAGRSLTYANPPASFERTGQKTRRISAVLGDGLATCLDSTLLFASAIEAVGLNPIVLMTRGHCFVGAWLVPKTLKRLVESDAGELRKALGARDLVTFETTLVTHRPAARFEDAIAHARLATEEAKERDFVAAIDIARARMSQIRPLASHQSRQLDPEAIEAGAEPPLPAAPDYSARPTQEAEERPTTASGRVDRWQRKLLDLSLRNRLLNFKLTKQAIPVLCRDVSGLEDRLAEGSQLRLISLPEQNPHGDRDAELHHKRTHKDLDVEFVAQALGRSELACPLDERDLDGRLTTLFRKVRNDLAEGGSNTLYLAVGFLKWKPTPKEEKIYRAPLLLVPVKLIRRSASSPFFLAHHEDDVRFNFTLLQLLKRDFDCEIRGFDGALPSDDSGVDVPRVLDQMRREVRDIAGLEVVDETAISTFSFAKYLMWKDLVDRAGELQRNRVVRHLIQDPDKPFTSSSERGMPGPREIDIRYTPQDIVHPLSADSSQLAAVMAASEGHDFVLIGPPGTGKSQTIANLIAQCLSVGKTILFVAEKTAALDVVFRRLREHGLGDCCVELHSNKAERRRFLEQLDASWKNNTRQDGAEWVEVSERLRLRRDELNAYVAAMHDVQPNGWTAFRAMGICVQGRDWSVPAPDWAITVRHDRAAYERVAKTVDDLALTFGAVSGTALPRVRNTEWSAAWEARLVAACQQLKTSAAALGPSLRGFTAAIGLPAVVDTPIEPLVQLGQFAKALIACAHEDVSTLFNKQFAKFRAALEELEGLIQRHAEAVAAGAARYPQHQLGSIPIDELEKQWRSAKAAFWPLSWLQKRKLTKLLQDYAVEGIAAPGRDLDVIRELLAVHASLHDSPLAQLTRFGSGLETDTASLRAHLTQAEAARSAILALGQPLQATKSISQAVLPALRDASGNHPIVRAARALLACTGDFTSAWAEFQQAAGAAPASKQSATILRDVTDAAQGVLDNRTLLRKWTAWCEVKQRARKGGLEPLLKSLESGSILPSELQARFELAYARWWLPAIIDGSESLRAFQSFRHEHAIEDFRQLDELARKAAAPQARRAVFHDLPPGEVVPRKSELGLLRHQISLKRPTKSIREIISGMPETFGKLAPCLLMSPLSVAQYLPANQALFDLVVFDEASQIATWDAIGAIARGKQTIIVGDPKQLPPTNFFGAADNDEDNDELDDHEKDLESILDEARASGLPTLQLNWHYRSRHESLIAFSNFHYYGNELVTFPAAESTDRGVSLRLVEGAVYDRGKSRTNRKEAEAIVADLVERMRKSMTRPESERLTYGVITFNAAQQTLIQDLLDQARRDEPQLEWFFADERIEPTAVKNLENVQGDERDVMLFSITFGCDIAGKFPIDFGAINREGGERRLNVAVTRARQELVVFASFLPDQLRVERTKAIGVRHLKDFLEYARVGPKAIAARTDGSVGGYESVFEQAVAAALEARGWRVDPQVGVSGFRVDLGIVHPDRPGAYLAGVECDGATYHRSAAARDRDKTRQQVLENLGWNIVRIWSPDWWYDAKAALENVHGALEELLQRSRTSPKPSACQEVLTDSAEQPASLLVVPDLSGQLASESEPPTPRLVASAVSAPPRLRYTPAALPDAACNQPRFHDEEYSAELRQMAIAVLEAESPIREDLLVRQVARAHGFGRAGANIRQRILDVLPDITSVEEATGRFLWSTPEPLAEVPFRYAGEDGERRSLDEVCLAELIGLVKSCPRAAAADDVALALAREIGLARLAQPARQRLETALALATEMLAH